MPIIQNFRRFMLWMLLIGLVLLGLIAYLRFATSAQAKTDKVPLCHKLGNGTFNYLSVDENAVPGHLGHGDYYYGGESWYNDYFKNLWCNNHIPQPSPSPSPVSSPTPVPSPTPTPTPVDEPTPTPEASPTPTPASEPTPTPRVDPSPAPEETPFPQPCNGCGDHSDGVPTYTGPFIGHPSMGPK